jgi:AmmeMemoRadiSam system protein A
MPDRDPLGATLLQLARNAIAERFGQMPQPFPELPELQRPGATFVTLKRRGALRGCIGSLAAYRPLLEDVRENARRAAFSDPRFLPLTADELPTLRVEVSLLSTPSPLSCADEAEALAQLRPGIDGLILSEHGQRATFLPQVWEDLPEPRQFLAHLKQKAGLPPDHWSADIRLERYQAAKWKEEE